MPSTTGNEITWTTTTGGTWPQAYTYTNANASPYLFVDSHGNTWMMPNDQWEDNGNGEDNGRKYVQEHTQKDVHHNNAH